MEELLSKQAPEVQELIKNVNKYRKVDNEKHLSFACDLFDLAQECGNEDLKDYASCALGDACCQNQDYSQALYYMSAGVRGLAKTDEYELLCRCYNELGIIFRSEGHFITSEDYFINAMEIARAHRLYAIEAMACSNFASLCEEMEAIERALEYHYRSIECCSFIDDEDFKLSLMAGDYAFIVKLYVILKDEESADQALAEMEKIIAKYPEINDLFDIRIARYVYYKFKNDAAKIQEMKALCLESFYACQEYIVYFDEAKQLIEILTEEKDYQELQKMYDRTEQVLSKDDLINLRVFLEEYKIKMYEALGDKERLMASYSNYYRYNTIKTVDNKRSFLTTLRLRSELAQQRTKNLFLSAAAETDPLTGIANRLKLNAVIDELFVLANEQGKTLAVEMMDIDFFKEVNDTYGHAKGDELLVTLANILKSVEDDKIFVARYGGDEFIIYYYDMTDEQIKEVARHIQRSMEIAGEALGIGKVTVSQGIVNHIPRPLNRAWDYMNAADLALYFVKNHGKANARIIHRATELETLAWDKVF